MLRERNDIISRLSRRRWATIVLILHITGLIGAVILANLMPFSSPALFVCIGLAAILGYLVAVILGFAHFSTYLLVLYGAVAFSLWKSGSAFWLPLAVVSGSFFPVVFFSTVLHRMLRREGVASEPLASILRSDMIADLRRQFLLIHNVVGMQGRASESLAESTTRLVDGDEILSRGAAYQVQQMSRAQNDHDQLADRLSLLADHLLSFTALLVAADGHQNILVRKLAEITIPEEAEAVLRRSIEGGSDRLKLAIRLTGEFDRMLEQCRIFLHDAGKRQADFNLWLNSVESTLRSREKVMSELKANATSLYSSIRQTHVEYSNLNVTLDRMVR